jgi:hypothetical protein
LILHRDDVLQDFCRSESRKHFVRNESHFLWGWFGDYLH